MPVVFNEILQCLQHARPDMLVIKLEILFDNMLFIMSQVTVMVGLNM